MFDIVIIGAGPAGSTLARLIDNNSKVLLLDKRHFSSDFSSSSREEKCCGGMLNSDAQREIARLGLSLPKAILCDPQPFMVRTLDLDTGAERAFQRHYINIHRQIFDRFLFEMAAAANKCEICTGALVSSVRFVDGIYEIEYIAGGIRHKTRAKAVVAADGGSSVVRRKLDKYHGSHHIGKTPYYVAIQEKIEFDCSSWDSYGAYFAKHITDYYGWLIPKEGYLLLGAALHAGKFASANFDRMKGHLIRSGLPLSGEIISRRGTILQRPRSAFQIQSSVERAVFLGEAGGFISPSSSEGISWAIKTGAAFADCLNSFDDIDDAITAYNRRTLPMKLKLSSKNLRSFAMYNPAARNLIFKTGLTSL